MEKRLFADLVTSLEKAAAITKRKARPARQFEVAAPNVKGVRERTGLSQSEFARVMRVSVRTLRNWEQKRCVPTGSAAALLEIVASAPDVALKALHR